MYQTDFYFAIVVAITTLALMSLDYIPRGK